MYEYIKYGADRMITLAKGKYADNDNLAVNMISHDEGYPEPWNNLSVNLSVKCADDCAFIDTNNNGREVIDWLKNNNIAHPTGKVQTSGFCTYPEVRFTLGALNSMERI